MLKSIANSPTDWLGPLVRLSGDEAVKHKKRMWRRRTPRRGIIQSNNTSGAAGYRLRVRAKSYLCIEVSWVHFREGHNGRVRSGSAVAVGSTPVAACRRAIEKREAATGAKEPWAPEMLWVVLARNAHRYDDPKIVKELRKRGFL